MKKKIALEFLWLVFALVLAFPLGYVFLYFLDISPVGQTYAQEEEVFLSQLYLLGVILSFVGVYLVRLVMAAIRLVTT